ncbi:MAG: hypothetical protein EZS28_031769 [Streblomastix strix]|uniref:OTU domain-containing protein n=1 Tax=Streblomastix strix TaxID=222440 RepID=A0A5J4URA1_9EUKA|nr:MAG: hypothetical protein EZS28_031769 [Streblomastix strix]
MSSNAIEECTPHSGITMKSNQQVSTNNQLPGSSYASQSRAVNSGSILESGSMNINSIQGNQPHQLLISNSNQSFDTDSLHAFTQSLQSEQQVSIEIFYNQRVYSADALQQSINQQCETIKQAEGSLTLHRTVDLEADKMQLKQIKKGIRGKPKNGKAEQKEIRQRKKYNSLKGRDREIAYEDIQLLGIEITMKRWNISIRTAENIRKFQGKQPKPRGGPHHIKVTKQVAQTLCQSVIDNVSISGTAMAEKVKQDHNIIIHESTANEFIRSEKMLKFGLPKFSFKRMRVREKERNSDETKEKRINYITLFRGYELTGAEIIYIDETPCNVLEFKHYGRAPVGQPAFRERKKASITNITAITAISAFSGVIHVLFVVGGVTHEVFLLFINGLLQHLQSRALLFTSAYSCELNPIEYVFGIFKTNLNIPTRCSIVKDYIQHLQAGFSQITPRQVRRCILFVTHQLFGKALRKEDIQIRDLQRIFAAHMKEERDIVNFADESESGSECNLELIPKQKIKRSNCEEQDEEQISNQNQEDKTTIFPESLQKDNSNESQINNFVKDKRIGNIEQQENTSDSQRTKGIRKQDDITNENQSNVEKIEKINRLTQENKSNIEKVKEKHFEKENLTIEAKIIETDEENRQKEELEEIQQRRKEEWRSTPTDPNQDRQFLESIIGYQIQDPTGIPGDCLFNSIACQVRGVCPIKLRNTKAGQEYLQTIAQQGSWDGEWEIRAISVILKQTVILQCRTKKDGIYVYEPEKSKGVIEIGVIGGFHYVALRKILTSGKITRQNAKFV